MTYADGLAAAAVHLRDMARRIRARAKTPEDRLAAATLETAADSLAELPQRPEPTGLEFRGG